MDLRSFLRAVAVQTASVAAVFVVLLALPLPGDFFRTYGVVTGPAAWVVCSLFTAWLLGLSPRRALTAIVLSGVAAGLVGVGLDHTVGIVAGLAVFASVAAAVPRSRVGAAGIEPAFSGLKGRRPNH